MIMVIGVDPEKLLMSFSKAKGSYGFIELIPVADFTLSNKFWILGESFLEIKKDQVVVMSSASAQNVGTVVSVFISLSDCARRSLGRREG